MLVERSDKAYLACTFVEKECFQRLANIICLVRRLNRWYR
jgi:hypothetical protein